jgi:hypothetical protein
MKIRNQLVCGLALALFAGTFPAAAQSTDLLELETITVGNAGPVTFVFSDHGTGASGYSVRSASSVDEPVVWENEAGAVVQALGNGQYQVTVAQASPDRFYSVIGANGDATPIQISFPSTSLEINEGDSASLTVNFSRAYFGTIRYSIGGTTSPADHPGLNGEVQVNGATSVLIPIELADNDAISQLKQLVLTLEAGSGAVVNSSYESTVTIVDNDADWRGTFIDADAAIGFVLRILQSDGPATATLVSDGVGLIPVGEHNATITFSTDVFSSTTSPVGMDTDNTFQNLPATLKLALSAANGQSGQEVNPTRVNGAAALIIEYPGRSHLNRTNNGTFVLFKPPAAPSTNKVQLVNAQ